MDEKFGEQGLEGVCDELTEKVKCRGLYGVDVLEGERLRFRREGSAADFQVGISLRSQSGERFSNLLFSFEYNLPAGASLKEEVNVFPNASLLQSLFYDLLPAKSFSGNLLTGESCLNEGRMSLKYGMNIRNSSKRDLVCGVLDEFLGYAGELVDINLKTLKATIDLEH